MSWECLIAVLEIIGGIGLFALSLSKRWVAWCMNKPILVPYNVLALALIGIAAGVRGLIKAACWK